MLALLRRIWNWPWEWPTASKAITEIKDDLQELMVPSKWVRPTDDSFHDLPTDQVLWIQGNGKCPYCHSSLFGGPGGGASQNMYCGNVECKSAFNVSDMVPWGQFIGSPPEQFLEWRKQAEDNIE